MERYNLIKEVGDGTFGSVWRAINKQTGEVVAIKKMKKKYYSLEECENLREVKSLRRMSHPNIVKLKEVIREHDVLYFVFEYMECNLYQLMKDRNKLYSEAEIRNWCFQVFQGLAYMHQCGYFHRDLKPENLLVTKEEIKIADFGLAREIASQPPFTEYVSTRWYRAPEVLLQSNLYGVKVDLWAMGAIMAELFTLRPLFPGASEADEICKICSIIGSPTFESWADGLYLAKDINYQFPPVAGAPLSLVIPSASPDAINLITSLCSWDPSKRPSAVEALQHSFFQGRNYVPPFLRPREAVARTPLVRAAGPKEQQSSRRYSGSVPYSKILSNFSSPKSCASVNLGVQRKLNMLNEDSTSNDKFVKSYARQPKYRPPGKDCPISDSTYKETNNNNTHGVSDVAEKFGKMTVGNRRQTMAQPRPPAMKAGVKWVGASRDLFMRPSQEVQPCKPFARKVVE